MSCFAPSQVRPCRLLRYQTSIQTCSPAGQVTGEKRTCADNLPMNLPANKKEAQARKSDQELLFKGIAIALIGTVILLGPYFARSPAVQDLLTGGQIVGWFALVLGVAFLGQYFLRRRAGR